MSYRTGPKIVTDGLVLCLDAADRNSYPGSGNTWYDLSNNLNLSIANTSGVSFFGVNFNGSNNKIEITSWPSFLNSDDSVTSRSWEVWMHTNAPSNTQGIFGHKTGSGSTYYSNGGIVIYQNKYAFNWYDNTAYRWVYSQTNASTNVVHIVGTFDGSDAKPRLYLNGILEATYGSSTNLEWGAGMVTVEMGYNSNAGGKEYLNGRIYVAKYYKNKALSASEVLQNYNATKGRFGL